MVIKSIILLLICAMKLSRSQLLNQQKTNDNSVNCEGTRDTRLVEHFFNLIFQEFYGIPPLCTCVQMCADQPMYCYPNGCMKTKTKEPYQTLIQKEDQRVSLVIKDQNLNFSSIFFDSSQNVNTKIPESTVDLLPNILKDRYKTLIKYKRTPSVELKHNLPQQVNIRKSPRSTIGNAYVSRARWPNRHKIQRKKKAVGINEAKLVIPVFNGNAPSIYTPPIAKKTTFKQENKQSIENSTLKDTQLPSSHLIDSFNRDNHSSKNEKKDSINRFDEIYNITMNDMIVSLANLIDKSNNDGNDEMRRLVDDWENTKRHFSGHLKRKQ